MKPAKLTLALIMMLLTAITSGSVLAASRGERSGGSHYRGSPDAGARYGGSHYRGPRAGTHYGGSHYRGPRAGVHYGGSRYWGPRVGFGIVVGAPDFWYYAPPYYYAPPVYYDPYYYPPAVAVPSPPPVYVEQGGMEPAPAPSHWWYYCVDAKAYYPYVNECPGGWQRVSPEPPPGS